MKDLERNGAIVHIDDCGVSAYLFIADKNDGIQRVQYGGNWWDPKDLEIMSKYMTPTTRYLDIGANVGNHVIYFVRKFGLSSVWVIEPNPVAYNILLMNVLLNNMMDRVNMGWLGYGLSNAEGFALLDTPAGNLGGTRCIVQNGKGQIPLTTGDKLCANRDFDFIKIDVEWMEMECLAGLKETIARCRPTMYIEVSGANKLPFHQWCEANKYDIVETYDFTGAQANYLIVPFADVAV